jgi:hypothetical protein
MAFPTAPVTPGSGLTVNTLPNAGQATMANSLSVAIASDQSSIPVTVTPVPIAPVRSTALEASHLFKSGAGSLFDTYCLTTSVSGYFMLFDAVTAPSDGAVPGTLLAVAVGGTNAEISFPYSEFHPLPFVTGLVAVFSTTGPLTKTASATAFMSGRVI